MFSNFGRLRLHGLALGAHFGKPITLKAGFHTTSRLALFGIGVHLPLITFDLALGPL